MSTASERCPGCTKRVYPNEKITIDGIGWHRGCFKCSNCGSTLKTAAAAAQYKGKYYCKSHVPVDRSERSSNRLIGTMKDKEKDEARDSSVIEKKRSSDDMQIKKEEGEKVLTPKLGRPESISLSIDKKKDKKEKKDKKDKDRDRKERDRKNKRSSLQMETNHTTSLSIPQLNSRLKDSGTLESPTVKSSNSHGDRTLFDELSKTVKKLEADLKRTGEEKETLAVKLELQRELITILVNDCKKADADRAQIKNELMNTQTIVEALRLDLENVKKLQNGIIEEVKKKRK